MLTLQFIINQGQNSQILLNSDASNSNSCSTMVLISNNNSLLRSSSCEKSKRGFDRRLQRAQRTMRASPSPKIYVSTKQPTNSVGQRYASMFGVLFVPEPLGQHCSLRSMRGDDVPDMLIRFEIIIRYFPNDTNKCLFIRILLIKLRVRTIF